jgi:AcrR family transcriptional regulator
MIIWVGQVTIIGLLDACIIPLNVMHNFGTLLGEGMPTKKRSEKQKKPTFTEVARRKQIIEATIQTLAEKGIVNSSMAEIANTIDIGKPVIRYYYKSKDELFDQTRSTIFERSDAFVRSQVEAEDSALEKLRAFIVADVGYVGGHRNEALAEMELYSHYDTPEAKKVFSETYLMPNHQYLGEILSGGQESGEFGQFPVATVTSLIIGALEGIGSQWTLDPESIDLDECGRTLLEMLEPFVVKRED